MPDRVLRYTWRAIWAAAEMTFKHTLNDGFVIFTILIQPLMIALLGLWMLGDKGDNYIMFVVVGSGLTGLWSGLLFVSGNSIRMERWSGTLETLVGMPTSLPVIIFGKNLANVILSLISMVVAYLIVSLLLGYRLTLTQPVLFAMSLLLTIVAFISFGLVIAPIFVMNPAVQQWQNAMEFPVYILAGFLFPIALLPNWTTPLSYVLPPYWAARALHGTSTGNAPLEQTLVAWGLMLGESLICWLVAGYLFKRMLFKVRSDASLDME